MSAKGDVYTLLSLVNCIYMATIFTFPVFGVEETAIILKIALLLFSKAKQTE